MIRNARAMGFAFLVAALVSGSISARGQAPAAPAGGPSIRLDVDASELPRRLLHAREEIPVGARPMRLWFPKWVPGVHGPVGPLENLGGLRFETPAGEPVPWRRDDQELYLFHVDPPEGISIVVARIDYICNQPSVNSTGVDSYGTAQLGVVNWNTCLLYPEGSATEIEVRPTLKLPEGWKHASSLAEVETPAPAPGDPAPAPPSSVAFAPTSLYRLIDSPLICGKFMKSIPLEVADFPPVSIEIASESAAALQWPEDVIKIYRDTVAEAAKLYGAAHFGAYKFLLIQSDQLPYNGLEHHECSLNGVGERDLLDEEKRKGWPGYLLPHEFMHSWCGKFRRPDGMAVANYHEPQSFNLLWVYEGLAQYLGEILLTRGGMISPEEYTDQLASKIGGLKAQQGRRWRSLEDTAVSSYQLRGHSANWDALRRGQDYYDEGLILWMEIDAILREKTDGKKSIDDFCRAFMGPMDGDHHPARPFLAFTREDVVAILNGLAPNDWAGLIDSRVGHPLEAMPLDVVERLGYRLQFSNEPTKFQRDREKERGYVSAVDALGLVLGGDGRVSRVIPGSPGDAAGLAPGMQAVGVNGRKFTPQRMRDAIADSVAKRKVDLLMLEGDEFHDLSIAYDGGPRYLRLLRNADKPDTLAEIIKPKARKPEAGKVEEKK